MLASLKNIMLFFPNYINYFKHTFKEDLLSFINILGARKIEDWDKKHSLCSQRTHGLEQTDDIIWNNAIRYSTISGMIETWTRHNSCPEGEHLTLVLDIENYWGKVAFQGFLFLTKSKLSFEDEVKKARQTR